MRPFLREWNYMTMTYSFADEKIENDQDRKWEKAVDDEI